jgi:hypothetical protein
MHPELAMGGSSGLAFWRIAMRRHDDIDAHLHTAVDCRVEIVDLEPQQDAVAIGAVVGLADATVIVLYVEVMQLHHEPITIDEALVVGAAVVAANPQQLLVPPAAGLDIGGTDQRLRVHGPNANPASTIMPIHGRAP